jgi:hypothetical protein
MGLPDCRRATPRQVHGRMTCQRRQSRPTYTLSLPEKTSDARRIGNYGHGGKAGVCRELGQVYRRSKQPSLTYAFALLTFSSGRPLGWVRIPTKRGVPEHSARCIWNFVGLGTHPRMLNLCTLGRKDTKSHIGRSGVKGA